MLSHADLQSRTLQELPIHLGAREVGMVYSPETETIQGMFNVIYAHIRKRRGRKHTDAASPPRRCPGEPSG
jgi:hypothetical protein